MALVSFPLGQQTLPKEELKKDKSSCKTAGVCGVGQKALYIGSRFVSRWYYIPWTEVSRVYKRVAMSSGGFTGKGVFGSMSYLVVEYPGGEKKCYVKHERDVDNILDWIRENRPEIKTFSREGEKRLAEAEEKERARYLAKLPEESGKAVESLREAKSFLEHRSSLSSALTDAARQKRITDKMPMRLRIVGAAVGLLGAVAVLAGLAILISGNQAGLYLIIGGAAVFFLMLSANLIPGKHNSIKVSNQAWDKAVKDMERYLKTYDGAFPLPAPYAHPVVLERMIRLLREGRVSSVQESYELMKQDLKALNAQVKVSQAEYDEVVKIKPLFLICDYQDTYKG